ncbi:MAG: hypothetical protein ACKO4R_15840, partial [Synechococcales cyanobacterium]
AQGKNSKDTDDFTLFRLGVLSGSLLSTLEYQNRLNLSSFGKTFMKILYFPSSPCPQPPLS